MSITLSFKANATPQETANAKASAKASLLGTAITAGAGAVAGGAIGAVASVLPCKPAVEKVLEGAMKEGDNSGLKPLAQDYFDKLSESAKAGRAKLLTEELEKLKTKQDMTDDIKNAIAQYEEELKKLPKPEKFEELQKSMIEAYKVAEGKAKELIQNAGDSDLIKNAKKVTKSMRRPNMIAKGIGIGVIAALLFNIVHSFRKPDTQSENIKSFQA